MRQVDGTEALERARAMRKAPTSAEKRLWGALRNHRLEGFKFRRQMWIGAYIADFVCMEARLIVELDGSQHGDTIDYDVRRDTELERAGYRTLRFWNNEVTGNLEGMLEAIRHACLDRVPSPSHLASPSGPLPLPEGEGLK